MKHKYCFKKGIHIYFKYKKKYLNKTGLKLTKPRGMATRIIIFQLKTKIKTIIQLVNYLRKKNLDSSAPGQKNLEKKG